VKLNKVDRCVTRTRAHLPSRAEAVDGADVLLGGSIFLCWLLERNNGALTAIITGWAGASFCVGCWRGIMAP
jgi:hypothetical protein